MELKTAKQLFFDTKEAEGITARTYQTYSAILKPFLLFVVDKNIFDVREILPEHISEYILRHKQRGVRNITLHRDFRVLKTFFFYLYNSDFIEKNIFEKLKPPKPEKKIMRTFTPKEIKTVLNSFDKANYYGMRNCTITELFFSTGIRKQEATLIKLTDLNITTELLKIHGKGAKERFVPIGRVMSKTLKTYLNSRADYLNTYKRESPYLFISKRGEKLTADGLGTVFQRIKEHLHLEGERVSCHTWRHTFAKNYLLNGGDVFSLQKILGHESLETTKQYLSLLTEDVKHQHAKFNPLDNTDWLI